MLNVHSINKSYGVETILKDVSFNLNSGERLGLIGPNGCGKSILMRILAGELKPDSGSFSFTPQDLRLGYLPQGLDTPADETVGEFLDRMAGGLGALTGELERLAASIARTPDKTDLQLKYDSMLSRIQAATQRGNWGPEALAALGLDHFPLDTPVGYLSGGQKTRLALAGALLSAPPLLLLDEPTNHLDIDMLRWMEDWLTKSNQREKIAALIVSHDRAFLDATVTGILELDAETHSVRQYAGNYSNYLEEKLAERERHWQAYSDQQSEIARLRRAANIKRGEARFRSGGKADSGDKFAKGFFSDQSKGTIARAKQLEKRLERLLNEDRIEKPGLTWQMKLDFGEVSESSRDVIILEDLNVGYDGVPILSGISRVLRYRERLALMGPNGAGKTTLLRCIAGELPPLHGRARLGPSVRLGYMAQEQETLDPELDAFTSIRKLTPLSETEARAFLHQFLFSGDEVFIPVGKLSYGERARLMLACLVASGCNLLLLDEPINHLDIPSRARFEQALTTFEGTVVAVVHDRYFIEGFATAIWEAREGKLNVLF